MSPNINLVNIDGKPLEKLLDVLQNVFGKLYEPKEIRKRADAKAYEIEKIKKAEVIAHYESIALENEYLSKINQRVLQKELRVQNNYDNIISIAAEQLKDKQNISDEEVDKDWINNFFDFAENISNNEMQALWGRILAGEIEKPGSFSLRALDLLRKMNKIEANCFKRFAELSITYSGTSFIINFINLKELEEKYNICYADRLLLEELGLVSSQDLVAHLEPYDEDSKTDEFDFGDKIIYTKRFKNSQYVNKNPFVHIVGFTKVGQELLKLVNQNADIFYLRLFASQIRKDVSQITYCKKSDKTIIDLPESSEEKEIGETRTRQERKNMERK